MLQACKDGLQQESLILGRLCHILLPQEFVSVTGSWCSATRPAELCIHRFWNDGSRINN